MMTQTLYLSHLHAESLQWLIWYVLPVVAVLPSFLLGLYIYRRLRLLRALLLSGLQGAVYYGLVQYSAGLYLHVLYTRLTPVYGDRTVTMLTSSLSLVDSVFLYVLPVLFHGIVAALTVWLVLAILAPDRQRIFHSTSSAFPL